MSWWFAACILLPLAAGQNIAPAFRPDSVTTVTGQIWCGNSPAGSIAVEWWTDRGQQIDTLLGSGRTDSNGRFQITTSQPASSNTYLWVRSNCNGNSQTSRTDVNLLSPFNIQIQLRSGSGPNSRNPPQVSGTVSCGNRPAVWQTVQWFADRGNQIDLPLGSSQTDGRGFFIITRSQTSDRNTYLILVNNCNGRQQTTRVNVNNNNPTNMRIQLQSGGRSRFSRQIAAPTVIDEYGEVEYNNGITAEELTGDSLNPISTSY